MHTSLLVKGSAHLSAMCSSAPAHGLSLALHRSLHAVRYWSEQDEQATQCSFNVRASTSYGAVKRFLAHPTSGSSDEAIEANGFVQKNAVSIASDHLFFSEGAMEGTVLHTGEHSILL